MNSLRRFGFAALLFTSLSFSDAQESFPPVGVARVQVLNYDDCIELTNQSTRVVLGHHVGGRLLVYESQGKNVLHLDPREADWEPFGNTKSNRVSAGRFDVGPEYLMPRGNAIWNGRWDVTVTGDRQARMTSQVDPKSKMQVIRDFKLDEESSRLTIAQTVENKGQQPFRQCYWSRTFAIHGGVVVVPCDPSKSLIPNLYYMSQHRYLIDFRPHDPAVRRVKDFLVVDGPPQFPKLGFDCTTGWAAYQTRDNRLFVKRFPVYPDKKYGDPGKINFALWYPEKDKIPACEIEPIGPLVELKPGEKSSFTVDWWLLDRKFPDSGIVDPEAVAETVAEIFQTAR